MGLNTLNEKQQKVVICLLEKEKKSKKELAGLYFNFSPEKNSARGRTKSSQLNRDTNFDTMMESSLICERGTKKRNKKEYFITDEKIEMIIDNWLETMLRRKTSLHKSKLFKRFKEAMIKNRETIFSMKNWLELYKKIKNFPSLNGFLSTVFFYFFDFVYFHFTSPVINCLIT